MATLTYTPDQLREDHGLTADELRIKYFDPKGYWDNEGEHPRFGKWDWLQVVAQRSTLLGYWDWAAARVDEAYWEERP